ESVASQGIRAGNRREGGGRSQQAVTLATHVIHDADDMQLGDMITRQIADPQRGWRDASWPQRDMRQLQDHRWIGVKERSGGGESGAQIIGRGDIRRGKTSD